MALEYPNSHVTVVELVPGVLDVFRQFRPNADELLAKPRGRVVLGDGRNYLLNQAHGSLDVIIEDPTPPLYGAGAVNLYTTDFFRLCATKLKSTGRLMMRLPWSADPASIKLVLRSAVEIYPHVTLWQQSKGAGYSLITSPGQMDAPSDEQLVSRLRRADWLPESRRRLMERVRPRQVASLEDVVALAEGAPLVTDEHPYLEHPIYYPLWFSH